MRVSAGIILSGYIRGEFVLMFEQNSSCKTVSAWGLSEFFLKILVAQYQNVFILRSLKILIGEIKVSILF